jgi:hypothetical protein
MHGLRCYPAAFFRGLFFGFIHRRAEVIEMPARGQRSHETDERFEAARRSTVFQFLRFQHLPFLRLCIEPDGAAESA